MENTTSTNTFGMLLKMKFIKMNLLRRRAGENEQTFVDFFNSIATKQMEKIKKEAKAAVLLREGVFDLKKYHIFTAFRKIVNSIFLYPNYIVQKFKKNILRN